MPPSGQPWKPPPARRNSTPSWPRIDTGDKTVRQPVNIDFDYINKAIVGIASPVFGVVTSFQAQIE